MAVETNEDKSLVAREVLWSYRGTAEERMDKDFYVALQDAVAAEIARRLRGLGRIWVGREIQVSVGAYTVRARLTNVEPLLATTTDQRTEFLARYLERAKDEGQDVSNFIAEIIRYPNEHAGLTFSTLVGLDEIKADIARKLQLLLRPSYLDSWVNRSYGQGGPATLVQTLRDRYPLMILEGEVGSGKTALARSIGTQIAKNLQSEIVLYVLNAQVRGGGHVGELTQNISRAFTEAELCQEREQVPVMILIDEADALAQARGSTQTHHEDDAGVNTLIQRIDRLRGRPMAVFFSTNLAQSLDAAIMRRAIALYHFDRPTPEQRREVFRRLLTNTGLNVSDFRLLVEYTEPRQLPGFGTMRHRFTYSDISQRIIPRAVEDAIYKRGPLQISYLINACQVVMPTPEMRRIHEEQPQNIPYEEFVPPSGAEGEPNIVPQAHKPFEAATSGPRQEDVQYHSTHKEVTPENDGTHENLSRPNMRQIIIKPRLDSTDTTE